MKVTRIGLDIAKQIFELHGVDRRGHVVVRKTLRRERVLEYFSQLPACEVALEACGGAHYWHREISKLGHTVRLLATNKVKPYLDGNKNNAHDAAAICEASSRPSMRWVEPKTSAQQDLQSLHRVRQVAVRQCTTSRARPTACKCGRPSARRPKNVVLNLLPSRPLASVQMTVVTISRMLRWRSRSSVMGELSATSAAAAGAMPRAMSCAA